MKSDILLKYENKWVALDKQRVRVLHSAVSMDSLLKKLSKEDEDNVILHFVPPFDGTLFL